MLLKNIIFSSFLLAGLTLTPVIAHAGFDWTPSPKKAESPTVQTGNAPIDQPEAGPLTPDLDMAEAPLPVPVGEVDSQSLPPPGTFATEQESQETQVALSVDASDEAAAPVVLTNDKNEMNDVAVQDVPVQAPVQTAYVADSSLETYEGFGNDLSLVLALRDIVPTQYAYSFSDPSYAGLTVSWRGGKPWQDVLNGALAAHQLTSFLEGQAIVISPVSNQPREAQTTPVAITPAAETEDSDPTSVVPVMKGSMVKDWTARPGYTLKEVMEDWGKVAKVDVEWSSPYDYPINNSFLFKGTYEEAVKGLLSQYSRETPRPRGRLYPNLPEGPSVLMIN
ncbi:MAG: TcpQ domain-containing protein [Alphaproteobacteria bacterium]|nr:TcpQ domain-containing protein [Alphaproteobacteria bacterium]